MAVIRNVRMSVGEVQIEVRDGIVHPTYIPINVRLKITDHDHELTHICYTSSKTGKIVRYPEE